MKMRDFPTQIMHPVQLVMQIDGINQQKAAWNESDFCASYDSYITALY